METILITLVKLKRNLLNQKATNNIGADAVYLAAAAKRVRFFATIEEHGLIGGLGSAVAEWRAAANVTTPLISFGTPDEFMHEVGTQEYARAKYGLTAENIAERILATVRKA